MDSLAQKLEEMAIPDRVPETLLEEVATSDAGLATGEESKKKKKKKKPSVAGKPVKSTAGRSKPQGWLGERAP